MSFVMPSKYDTSSLPRPNNPDVKIVEASDSVGDEDQPGPAGVHRNQPEQCKNPDSPAITVYLVTSGSLLVWQCPVHQALTAADLTPAATKCWTQGTAEVWAASPVG